MKTYHFLLLCSVFNLVLSARLDFNSEACNNYLKKFGTANASNGVGPTSLAFTGDAAFVDSTANVKVNLRYSDSLYNDATFFGLVQEDGKTAEQTCLDLKLWKFTGSDFSNGVQVADLPFTASSNLNKKWRYLSFTINGADMPTRMVQSSNSYQYVYTGYYAVAYYAAGTTQVQYTYYFQFAVTVNRSTGAAVSTVFKPLSQKETVGCTPNATCIVTPSSKLIWCTDAACATNTVPDLSLNDQFYIRQQTTTAGLTAYYLTNTTVTYVGDGLNKKTTPVSIDNSVAGQVTMLLTADIAWSNVAVQVTSYASTTTTGARRFLEETTTTYDPVSGTTDTISCIKLHQGDSTCETEAQYCAVNYDIECSCPKCPCTGQLLAVALYILLLFVF